MKHVKKITIIFENNDGSVNTTVSNLNERGDGDCTGNASQAQWVLLGKLYLEVANFFEAQTQGIPAHVEKFLQTLFSKGGNA